MTGPTLELLLCACKLQFDTKSKLWPIAGAKSALSTGVSARAPVRFCLLSAVLPRSRPLFHHLFQEPPLHSNTGAAAKLCTRSRRRHGVAGRNSGFAWLRAVLPRQGTSQEPCPPVLTSVCLSGGAEEQTVPLGGGRFCSVVPESADAVWSWCGASGGESLYAVSVDRHAKRLVCAGQTNLDKTIVRRCQCARWRSAC